MFCFGRKSDVTSDPKKLRRQNRQQAGNEARHQGNLLSDLLCIFFWETLSWEPFTTSYIIMIIIWLKWFFFLLHSKFKVDEHAMNEIIGVWSFLQHSIAQFLTYHAGVMFSCLSFLLIPYILLLLLWMYWQFYVSCIMQQLLY